MGCEELKGPHFFVTSHMQHCFWLLNYISGVQPHTTLKKERPRQNWNLQGLISPCVFWLQSPRNLHSIHILHREGIWTPSLLPYTHSIITLQFLSACVLAYTALASLHLPSSLLLLLAKVHLSFLNVPLAVLLWPPLPPTELSGGLFASHKVPDPLVFLWAVSLCLTCSSPEDFRGVPQPREVKLVKPPGALVRDLNGIASPSIDNLLTWVAIWGKGKDINKRVHGVPPSHRKVLASYSRPSLNMKLSGRYFWCPWLGHLRCPCIQWV